MGLYLVMFAINLPASILIVPLMEKVATYLGWSLGEAPHILITQVTAMLINTALLLIVLAGARRIRSVFKAHDGAD
jgi:membrane protein DedA with SNARE-associated domain